MMQRTIAVLGAGIMGVCTALWLVRHGVRVCLFDQQGTILNGASRWNEGKIHLGYLYSGDKSGNSARAMQEAGLAFKPLLETLIGVSFEGHVTQHSDTYIVHPDSVVSADSIAAHFNFVDKLLKEQDISGSLGPIHPTRRLTSSSVDQLSAGRGLDGFEVPEYSVNTQWLANRLRDAVLASSDIELVLGSKVVDLARTTDSFLGPWTVETHNPKSLLHNTHGPFDAVVNALWEGRASIDQKLNLPVAGESLHRFRKSVFITTDRHFDVPSRVFALGPFGDIKNYDGVHFYVSWYPAGLIAQGEGISPPIIVGELPDREVLKQTRKQIEYLAPDMIPVFDAAIDIKVEGGWVYAQGRGRLDKATASIHRRDKYGIVKHGTYYSVDTGKYSVAPFMARTIASSILARSVV